MSRPAARAGCALHVTRAHRRPARDRGAAAVEFALVVPLLLTLAFGITEFGRAYDTQAALSQGARAGARALALGGTASDARSAAQDAADDLDLTTAEITVSPTTCVGTAPGATATVVVNRRQPFLTGLFGSSIALSATAVMGCTG